MRDQRAIWEAIYQRSAYRPESTGASDFAHEVAGHLKPESRVLELGCGAGDDSAFFAGLGHDVTGVDFARSAVVRAHAASVSRVGFAVADIAAPLPFAAAAFDAVYARLSLHYFSDARTRGAIGEISRVLRFDGLLAFMCKSLADPAYGKGKEIEPHMFESDHVRHFFSEAYARECLYDGFEVVSLESVEAQLYGRDAAYVKTLARRR